MPLRTKFILKFSNEIVENVENAFNLLINCYQLKRHGRYYTIAIVLHKRLVIDFNLSDLELRSCTYKDHKHHKRFCAGQRFSKIVHKNI